MTPREIIANVRVKMTGFATGSIGLPFADEAIDALHSAGYRILGPGEWDAETDWQPIETIPRNTYESVLIWVPGINKGLDSAEVAQCWCDEREDPRENLWSNGGPNAGDDMPGWCNATHWRPLPAPPAIRALAKEKQGC